MADKPGDAVIAQDPSGSVGFGAILRISNGRALVQWQNGSVMMVPVCALIPAGRLFEELVGDHDDKAT